MMRTALKFFLVLGILHLGGMVLSPYIAHKMLKMKVTEIVSGSRRNSEQFVQDRILEYAQEKRIPISRRDLHVWRQGKQIQVVIRYDRVVNIPVKPYELDLQLAVPRDAVAPGFRTRRY